MKIILKEDVKGLGIMGNVVNVANGYGRNYLIPQNLALEANPKNIKQLEHEKNAILARSKKIIRSAEDMARNISSLTVIIEVQSGEEDKLFGSVTSMDIAEAISKKGIDIDRRKIVLEEPIKRLGTYTVPLKLHHNVASHVTVEVIKAASATEA